MWRSVTWCSRKSRSQHDLADPLNILDIIQMESNLSLLREKAATMRYDSRLMLNIAFLHNAGAALRRGSRMGTWTVFALDPVMAPGVARAWTTNLDIEKTPVVARVWHINLVRKSEQEAELVSTP